MNTNSSTTEERIYEFQKYGVKLDLRNITAFLTALGNPEKKFRAIHIAGSNGKGSTASYIASILMESGYSVGLYTSPHFVRFHERILVNGEYITDEAIREFLDAHAERCQELKMTFFEFTTAMAFEYFAKKKIDIAVVETGLGGRLDATNVIPSEVQVITTISLEHTEYLGDSLELIASEKAGIVKEGAKVFTGKLPPEAIAPIQRICNEKNSTLFYWNDFYDSYYKLFQKEETLRSEHLLPLRGSYQRANAALAAHTVLAAQLVTDMDAVLRGIRNTVANTHIQGRCELVGSRPTLLFDSAHNPEGLSEFIAEFNTMKKTFKHTTVLFAAMRDKAIDSMLAILKGRFDRIVLTSLEMERAATTAVLSDIARTAGMITECAEDAPAFVQEQINERYDGCIVICGSMYLVGAIKSAIQNSFGT